MLRYLFSFFFIFILLNPTAFAETEDPKFKIVKMGSDYSVIINVESESSVGIQGALHLVPVQHVEDTVSFEEEFQGPGGPYPLVGDFNGDGWDDILVCFHYTGTGLFVVECVLIRAVGKKLKKTWHVSVGALDVNEWGWAVEGDLKPVTDRQYTLLLEQKGEFLGPEELKQKVTWTKRTLLRAEGNKKEIEWVKRPIIKDIFSVAKELEQLECFAVAKKLLVETLYYETPGIDFISDEDLKKMREKIEKLPDKDSDECDFY